MSGHMRPVATMPGVLIDESEADDSTRALFYAAETPTQADVIRTARWLGVDPLQHAFNLDLNFSELEPGDLAALGYRFPPDDQPQRPAIQDDEDFPAGPLTTRQTIGLVLMFVVAMMFTSATVVHLWARWSS